MVRHLYTFLFLLFLFEANAQNPCRCDEGEKFKPEIYRLADNGKIDSAFLVYEKVKAQNSNACLLFYYHGTAQLHMQKKNWVAAWLAISGANEIIKTANCI